LHAFNFFDAITGYNEIRHVMQYVKC